eukprot:8865278-Alexandrium_andersonii.AAC.1
MLIDGPAVGYSSRAGWRSPRFRCRGTWLGAGRAGARHPAWASAQSVPRAVSRSRGARVSAPA